MTKWITVLFWVLALSISSIAMATVDDGVTVTGEKGFFSVFTADTVPDGKLSFSANYNNIDRDPLDVDISYYSLTLGYGITDNFEFVALVTPYVGYDIDPKFGPGTVNGREVHTPIGIHGSEYRSGFGDIRIGGKYIFARGANFGIGVDAFLKIPTASETEGRGTGKLDGGASLVVSGTAGGVNLAANAGYAVQGDPKHLNDQGVELPLNDVIIGNSFIWGVGASFPARASTQGIVELNGSVLPDDAEYDRWTDLTAGLRFRIHHALYFTAAARWNIEAERDESQYPYGGFISLAYAPGREGPAEAVPPPPPPSPPPPAPPAPPPTPSAPTTPSVPEFVWPEVYFPFNQSNVAGDASMYVITAENRQKLDSVATYLTDHPNVRVTIEGHCCYIGTEEYNLALGQARAEAIKQYIAGKGVSADRMQTISYGKTKPKYDNEKEITRRFNRRGYFVAITPQN